MTGCDKLRAQTPDRGRRLRAANLALALIALALTLWGALPLRSSAATPEQEKVDRLRSQIDRARKKIGAKKGTERVLTPQIAGYSRRIERLQRRIARLRERQGAIEADLDAKRSELERLQTALRAERARVARLRRRFHQTRRVLRARVVEIYKSQRPDLISVHALLCDADRALGSARRLTTQRGT